MSECKRTHVTGTEYKTMRIGKYWDGKDMMQKDPSEKRIKMQKSLTQQDLDGKGPGWKGLRCTRIRISDSFQSEHLNLKSKPCYFDIL